MNSPDPFEDLKHRAHAAATRFTKIESGQRWYDEHIGSFDSNSKERLAVERLIRLYIGHYIHPLKRDEGVRKMDEIYRGYRNNATKKPLKTEDNNEFDMSWFDEMFERLIFISLARDIAFKKNGIKRGEVTFICPICGGQAIGVSSPPGAPKFARLLCENNCVNSIS